MPDIEVAYVRQIMSVELIWQSSVDHATTVSAGI